MPGCASFFLTGCEIVTQFAICSPIKSTELRTSTAHLMPPRHLTLHGSVANSISLTLFLQIVLQIDLTWLASFVSEEAATSPHHPMVDVT